MNLDSRIYVAGHQGLVGSAIMRRLKEAKNLIVRTRQELDLTNQNQVEHFFSQEKPEYVFLAAAKVGGIHANNSYPADFIRDNLAIQQNVIHNAWKSGAKKLLFLGSSCIYPRDCPQPIKEEYLLTGTLEPTNEYYAIAKIAGLKMCEAYRKQYGFNAVSAMPTNLYGPGDNFHPENSHVIPALIRRFVEAAKNDSPKITIWGTGKPCREFLHVDDMADAVTYMMTNYNEPDPLNIGWGKDTSIASLAENIAMLTGYSGDIEFDHNYPDGTPRKLLDTSRMQSLGWSPRISLFEGLNRTIGWYKRETQS